MSSEPKAKTKRPGNTAFKQQRLKAWQPILTPKTVIPTFLIIGAIFIPIGIGLYIASERVNQVIFDYTDCYKLAPATFAVPVQDIGPVSEWKFDEETKECSVRLKIDEIFSPPVFIYYRLTNFYQNHRRYVKSFDSKQIKGDYVESSSALDTACDPFRNATTATLTNVTTSLSESAQYYPCDDISNLTCVSSSETFGTQVCDPSASNSATFEFQEKGIAWPSDHEKFGKTKWLEINPSGINSNLVPPDAWREAWPERFGAGYTQENVPNLQTWERLQVWMRVAGLPNFRKLWGRNDANELKTGVWELTIRDKFNVTRFGGTKSIVISTVSILGAKNPFLGVAYMVVGGVCILLGVLFLARHMIKPRKLGDHNLLSWNKDPLNRQH